MRRMDCRDSQFYLRLRRHTADELGPEVTADLDRHLLGCPRCAAEAGTIAAFDRAVATAMRDVPVPPGLRNRLVSHLSERRGATLRRKVYRYAALAAALLLGVGIGYGAFRSTRPELDTRALAERLDAQNDGRAAEEAVRRWLEEQKLPVYQDNPQELLPKPFDYELLVSFGTERVQGRDVPVVVFRESPRPSADPNEAVRFNPAGLAKVYIFRANDQFDTRAAQEAATSSCKVEVIRDRPGFVYVIVHPIGTLDRFCRGWGGRAG
jgi:anti-sigma factor RsiW